MDRNILSQIGNTPLVRLNRLIKNVPFRLFAKLEAFNPGGSIKDRAALAIIKAGIESRKLSAGTTIVESSSGNMGIGLAQVCAFLGFKFICVIDPKTTRQNVEILRAYGAEVDLVSEPDPITGEFLQARINRVQELLRATPNSFWPDQYSNINNPKAHHQTMREIVSELGERVDYIFCATSTCGTVRGCAEYVRDQNLNTKVIAVDAVGSVIFGQKPAKRLIPGHGAAVRPKLHQDELVDRCVHVTDLDCVIGCRRLVRDEAILAGGSSGAVVMAVDHIKEEILSGSTCAVILADRGERYLDTIYSDSWVEEHFGAVSHLWEDQEDVTCMKATY
jgi:N-(2-amino-2-carboxyethyl)-L-glutamate synthase